MNMKSTVSPGSVTSARTKISETPTIRCRFELFVTNVALDHANIFVLFSAWKHQKSNRNQNVSCKIVTNRDGKNVELTRT
eukprot:m.205741 g.205741  ORF g.205741 m.205741 type:complete len:80 (+) comp18880_c0_seq34:181-420(+)